MNSMELILATGTTYKLTKDFKRLEVELKKKTVTNVRVDGRSYIVYEGEITKFE